MQKKKLILTDFTWILLGEITLLGLILAGELVSQVPLAFLRAILGLGYTLFMPGYVLQVALFPRNTDLDGSERVAISFGLSVAIVAPLALLLYWMPWGIRFWSIVIAEGLLLGLFLLAAILRRGRLPVEARFLPALRVGWRGFWAAQDRTARALYGLLGFAVVLAVFLMISFMVQPSQAEFFTEFYLLGPEGLAEHYPRQANVGEQVGITVGLSNHERLARSYYVEVWVQDPLDAALRQQVGLFGMYELDVGESLTAPLTWQMPWAGDDQQVEFLLFMTGEPEVYRELRLWLDVMENE